MPLVGGGFCRLGISAVDLRQTPGWGGFLMYVFAFFIRLLPMSIYR
jgi:hypothetical protein